MRILASLLLLGPLGLLSATTHAQSGNSPTALEEFALATDRAVVVASLVPGTPDYYYYSCLERQHAADLAAVPPLLANWKSRHGESRRFKQIENRQALLQFGTDPQSSYAFLRRRLGLRFDHQRRVPGAQANLPTSLDPTKVSTEAFTVRQQRNHKDTLEGYEGAALRGLVHSSLSDRQLRQLLDRLQRPDVPGLGRLVVRDLATKQSQGFGTRAIHKRMLLHQLDTCLSLRPTLLADSKFIEVYLVRLLPGADLDWSQDAAIREAYLDRLWNFVQRLPNSQNSLKSHVLQHRLIHDLAQGQPSRERFLTWLQLPRDASWTNQELRSRSTSAELVRSQSFRTKLGTSANGTQLMRTYLEHFLATDASTADFTEYVEQRFLDRVFAEIKILRGEGDMERWYSLLDDPTYYEQLHQRVELRFAVEQPSYYGAGDPVRISVDLKNVETLLVKVFEIDTLGYYLATGQEIDASLPLDGLIAGNENTYEYGENPLRRVRRSFDFPGLSGPGVYVVEFIAGGLSSRAVIRKGRLQLRERIGSAGQVLRVLDELGVPHPEASIWLAGREYTADEDGEVYLPFSNDPGERNLVLRSGQRCSLTSWRHLRESYRLEAGVVLDREALLASQETQLILRPRLSLHGESVSLELLENCALTIRSTGPNGADSTLVLRDLKLNSKEELLLPFQVPAGTRVIQVNLTGKLTSLTGRGRITLRTQARTFHLSLIDQSIATESPLLGKDDKGWFVDVLGKNGEPKMGHSVTLGLRHVGFTTPMQVSLETDRFGRVRLGALPGITNVQPIGLEQDMDVWSLTPKPIRTSSYLHGTVGRVLRLPMTVTRDVLGRPQASLIELRDDSYAVNRREHITLAGGYLELRDLPAGNYSLKLYAADLTYHVHITDGPVRAGWALGKDRWLQLSPDMPLQVQRPEVHGDQLVVHVSGASPQTRVHVLADRYASPYEYLANLSHYRLPELDGNQVSRAVANYHSGRTISDEYRYVLERRFAKIYPGNMLERPSLLLNPWAAEITNSLIGIGGGAGGKFGGRSGGKRNLGSSGASPASPNKSDHHPAAFPNLDFLPRSARMLLNQKLDENGVLSIPLEQLGDGQWIHVLVIDEEQLAGTDLALPWKTLTPKDRRLSASLPPDKHLTEQRHIEYVAADQTVVIADASASDAHAYDSLASVFGLYQTIAQGYSLDQFEFLTHWNTTTEEDKHTLYSDYACHEFHLFLYHKDKPFFDRVVRSYLANKGAKTFLDHWLLEDDLTTYLEPWEFGRLNVLERILLGRRLPGQASSIESLVRDQSELAAPNSDRTEQLFTLALAGGALDTKAGLNEDLRRMRNPTSRKSPDGPSSPGPLAGIPGGGGGGRGFDEAQPMEVESMEEEPVVEDFETGDKIATGADDFLGRSEKKSKDAGRRKETARLFRDLAPTRRYLENNYWQLLHHKQNAGLLPVNRFWLDFAQADPAQPFVSSHFAEAASSLNEALLALALLDLPFEAAEHSTQEEGMQLSMQAGSPLLLVRKGLAQAELDGDAPRVLVAQDIFRLDSRYVVVNGRKVESFERGDLRTGVAYGCRVVLTNPNGIARELELLLQIPQGALPLSSGFVTQGKRIDVRAYGTNTLEYAFYFPAPGEFTHYPLHASESGSLLAWSTARTLTVTDQDLPMDNRSWEHVSQSGTTEVVLAYLAQNNLLHTSLDRMAWRLRDKGFFTAVTALLSERHVFHRSTWSYGLYHRDEVRTREFLQHATDFVQTCGPLLDSPLLNIDPVARGSFEQVDYQPLVNARAHALAGERTIADQDLARQYTTWLDVLAHRAVLTDADRLTLAYYLLLQDRIEQALETFGKIEAAALDSRLQYDYLAAYVDFFSEDHVLARGIAEQYQDHPVPRWRERFQTVLRQLDEAEGRVPGAGAGEDPTGTEALLASEAALDLEVTGGQVVLHHTGVESAEVRYYAMDVEFLFSTNPFVQQDTGSFAYVRPNRQDPLILDPKAGITSFALPAEFASSNVIVEVRGAGVIRRTAHYANALSVLTMESAGQIKVTHATTGKPLARVYVKVYSRGSGGSKFHKDGYTDLRGRFDYALLSSGSQPSIERFAILVLSEEDGAVIREVDPPLR